MKKKKLYQILPLVMVGICVAGMCAVGVRIFAKKVMIGKLGIENYVTCALADYNWGDRLERTVTETNETESKPERLKTLEQILEEAPVTKEDTEESDSVTFFDQWKSKVVEKENDIEKYCNDKFLLYTGMRSFSRGFSQSLKISMRVFLTYGILTYR